jgi:predicted TPR repeat methyltransferase
MSETDNHRFALAPPASIVDQFVWLPEQAAGRRVLHLGCVDDQLTVQRLASGRLLHKLLADRADTIIGVDISERGLEILADAIPGPYIVGDVERLDDLDLPDVDLVIAAEIIEHLGSPAAFLEGLGRYLARTGATAIITTPSAFSWRTLAAFVFSRRELVHPDHRLVYTPTTLRRTIELAGLETTSMSAHVWRDARPGLRQRAIDLVDRVVLRWNPWLAVGLIAEVAAPAPPDRP